MDYESIRGYKSLSDQRKKLFRNTYELQSKLTGCPDQWKPTSIVNRKGFLKVHFSNGEWLHYYLNGTWA